MMTFIIFMQDLCLLKKLLEKIIFTLNQALLTLKRKKEQRGSSRPPVKLGYCNVEEGCWTRAVGLRVAALGSDVGVGAGALPAHRRFTASGDGREDSDGFLE